MNQKVKLKTLYQSEAMGVRILGSIFKKILFLNHLQNECSLIDTKDKIGPPARWKGRVKVWFLAV